MKVKKKIRLKWVNILIALLFVILFSTIVTLFFVNRNISNNIEELKETVDDQSDMIEAVTTSNQTLEKRLEELEKRVEDNYWFFYDQGVSEYKGEYEYYE